MLWLAEPGRRPAQRFLDQMQAAGWHEQATVWDGPWPDPQDADVVVMAHGLQRPLDK